MFEQFPYTDMHQLNLDWIVKIAKDFLDQYTHIQELIADGEQSLTDLTTDGLAQLQAKADEIEGLLNSWYDTHSADIAAQLADSLAELNTVYNQTILNFNSAADAKISECLAQIPADYSELVSMLDSTTGNYEAVFVSGSRSMATPQVVDPSANWKNVLIECTPMQEFQVSGSGGVTSQLWMFFDSNFAALTSSGSNTRWGALQPITAPANAKYLIINSRTTEEPTYVGKCIVGSYIREDIEKTANALRLSNIRTRTEYQKGYINYSDINTVVDSESWKCAKIEVMPGQKCMVKGSGGSANQLWFVATENGTILLYAGDTVRTTDYIEFMIPPTGKYLIVNQNVTEDGAYPNQIIIGYPVGPEAPLCKFTYNGIDVSQFTSDSGASDWYWLTDTVYPAGYIDHVTFYGTSNSIGHKGYVAIYDIQKRQCLFSSDGVEATSTTITVDVKAYFPNPVYVAVRIPHLCHRNYGSVRYYANMWQFVPPLGEGVVMNIPWEETQQAYKFAFEVWYDTSIIEDPGINKKSATKVFIAGDSITAGYPYMEGMNQLNNPDLRYGNQLARKYGFDVEYGAETGGGWISLPNPTSRNAITIANSTDFSNYDVAVFAFGTNDYGSNIELGTVNDMYPTNQTVCGSINYIANKVYTDNPGIVLIISTPINRADRGTAANNYGYGTANAAGYTLMQLLNKMIEVCRKNGICVIDNSDSPFNKYSMARLMFDALHPSVQGYKILGPMLADRIAHFITPFERPTTE